MHIQRKKVAVVTKYFYPVVAGIENNILQTYSALQRDFGWDVTIHTTRDTYTEKSVLPAEAVFETLRVKRYKSTSLGFTPDIDWDNTNVVALHNFDFFFIRYLVFALYLKWTGRKTFKLVLTPHGGFNPEWSTFSFVPRVVKWIYTYTLGACLINLSVDAMRTVSAWEYGVAIRHIFRRKVHTIDNGLEDEAYEDVDSLASSSVKDQVRGYGRYIIQIARVYPIKNIETTIAALQYLPADISFVIVGQLQDPEYEEKLRFLIKKLGLESRVIFLGVVRGVDKYYLLRHAVAMAHMALWESYGNVLREGMSQGLPCVTSNVYNMPLLVKNGVNGFCLPVHASRQVAEKVNWIIDPVNEIEVKKIKKCNIMLGKNQSWRDVARKMDALYRDPLN